MASARPTSAFVSGIMAGLPFVIVVIPFAMLFGVVATEAGLAVPEVIAFSFLVIAGASQFAALQFMSENAPTLIVMASALAVNLRMAMYSASITPHLGGEPLWKRAILAYFLVDQTYALAIAKYDATPAMTPAQKTAFFIGTILPICPFWYLGTWLGVQVGALIPVDYGLDFIVPIAFLAIVAPGLRTPAHIVAAVTSVVAALALYWVPLNLGLLIAACLAMVAGAEVERRST